MDKYHIPESIARFMNISDAPHPMAGLTSILPEATGIEEDIKRKGMMSEIIRRLTRLEEAVRKLQAGG